MLAGKSGGFLSVCVGIVFYSVDGVTEICFSCSKVLCLHRTIAIVFY